MDKSSRFLHKHWRSEGGYREVLKLAIPLILSTGAVSVQHFIDRMFLTWYSPEAIAAVTPAGMVNFTIMSLFIGTAIYVTTFVAQYFGSGQYEKIGPAVWQGIYVALIGGLIHLIMIPFASFFFRIVGHDELVQQYEIRYFQILCLGAAPAIASSAMSGFFSGRGVTWPVMWVNVFATGMNIVLDYILIFGNFGFPELGVSGAAVATVSSYCFSFLIYLGLISRHGLNVRYNTMSGWRFDSNLFRRLMMYGFPNGVQFFLDISGFTIFILLIGRMGTIYLASTNIAFNINSLAFMPMLGIGRAVSILVGQKIGENRPDMAERSAYTGFYLTFSYMSSLAFLYVFFPNIFLAPFAAQASEHSFVQIREITVVLLRFVAFYSLFDALNIIFASAIKGAGDTRFVMFAIVIVSLLVLVIPSYIALVIFHAHIYVGWAIASLYICVLGLVFLVRFLKGKWKSMSVIEEIPPSLPSALPETPFTELEP
ncbi:MAG TPA: MATE family efflux transporter [bacterium]|nr:MATE family efflux transporter [bacterium]